MADLEPTAATELDMPPAAPAAPTPFTLDDFNQAMSEFKEQQNTAYQSLLSEVANLKSAIGVLASNPTPPATAPDPEPEYPVIDLSLYE